MTKGDGGGVPPPSPSPDKGDDDVKLIHVVQRTIAPTTRTTLDLLSLPFPFSQVDLLDPSEFIKAANQRRIGTWVGRDLDESGLQELHRQRILVPFYCVSIAEEPAGEPIDISESLTAQHVRNTHVAELYSAAASGGLAVRRQNSSRPGPPNGCVSCGRPWSGATCSRTTNYWPLSMCERSWRPCGLDIPPSSP